MFTESCLTYHLGQSHLSHRQKPMYHQGTPWNESNTIKFDCATCWNQTRKKKYTCPPTSAGPSGTNASTNKFCFPLIPANIIPTPAITGGGEAGVGTDLKYCASVIFFWGSLLSFWSCFSTGGSHQCQLLPQKENILLSRGSWGHRKQHKIQFCF